MRVHIVLDTANAHWILGKMANKLSTGLLRHGVECSCSGQTDSGADVNFFVPYYMVEHHDAPLVSVAAVYHSTGRTGRLREVLVDAAERCHHFTTQSQWMKTAFCTEYGVDHERVTPILPGVDGFWRPRKFVVGLPWRVYRDGRKCEGKLKDLLRAYPEIGTMFRFYAIGLGWESIQADMVAEGVEFDVTASMEYEDFRGIHEFDIAVFTNDEDGSSLGVLDCLAAGIAVATPEVDFAIDAQNVTGGVYFWREIDDLAAILLDAVRPVWAGSERIREWTWENYAKEHAEMFVKVLL